MNRRFSKVLVTGGAGYVGCVLVPALLNSGYQVTVFDALYFGQEGLPAHSNLKVIQGDIRNIGHLRESLEGHDCVIHLACISNDPSFELNESLSRSINFDCFEPMVVAAKESGIKRFIYASTSSVYGVSDAPDVTEEHPLVPITDYNKYKGLTEPLLLKHASDTFVPVVIRPATVCGYSPRMRLDLSVNILTNHAVNKRKITVFGGPQKRPNIHIQDLAELYTKLLEYPDELIAGQIFNAGYQNRTIADIAEIVRSVTEQEMPQLAPIAIETAPTDDIRSYHVNSEKIKRVLGWEPRRSIEDAVRELCHAFREGLLPASLEDSRYYNVRKVTELGLS